LVSDEESIVGKERKRVVVEIEGVVSVAIAYVAVGLLREI